jgi:hypothetical protein
MSVSAIKSFPYYFPFVRPALGLEDLIFPSPRATLQHTANTLNNSPLTSKKCKCLMIGKASDPALHRVTTSDSLQMNLVGNNPHRPMTSRIQIPPKTSGSYYILIGQTTTWQTMDYFLHIQRACIKSIH